MTKVLRHYADLGVVRIYRYNLPGFQPNSPAEYQNLFLYHREAKGLRNRQQVLPHTDCLLRNMHRFDYLSVQDTDEVIMPAAHRDYRELLRNLTGQAGAASISARSHFSFA